MNATTSTVTPLTRNATWPLLAGVGLLMIGNGLQATLLGVRASLEGYSSALIGVMMAGYFFGFLFGATWTPSAVRSVGHIRVFAALASLASVTILMQGSIIEPVTWLVMRIITGFCYAGILVIAESWLNQAATNETRGRTLSLYMVITFGGMALGQALMTLAKPETTLLFILASVLISVAAVPMLLSASTKVPDPSETLTVSIARLYRVSPLGVLGTFIAGLINGAVFGMGAVFAQRLGLDVADTAILLAALIVAAAVLQWPIGRLSDIIDRRQAIGLTGAVASGLALWAAAVQGTSFEALVLSLALFGGFGLTIHALCLAHTNDHLEPTELVGASSGLVIILAAGSIAGPLVVGVAMAMFGASAFPVFLAACSVSVALAVLWRMRAREALPQDEQGPFMPVSTQASGVVVEAAEEIHAEEIAASQDPDTAIDVAPNGANVVAPADQRATDRSSSVLP